MGECTTNDKAFGGKSIRILAVYIITRTYEVMRTGNYGTNYASLLISGFSSIMQHSFSRALKFGCSFFVILSLSSLALAGDPLPANRKLGGSGWNGHVGVPSGIPNRTTIFQTIPAGASTSTIQTAINNCPAGQVVLLLAGTYNLSMLTINRSNITLRGSVDANGKPTTIINASGNGVLIGECCSTWYPEFEAPHSANHRSWTSGYAQGSTSITLSSTSGMSVGQLIILDQLNDSETTAASPVNPDGPYVGGEYTSVAHPGYGYDRIQFQVNRIAAISGNTVTLSEPIYMPNWSGSLSPEAWTYGSGVTNMVVNSGVENLKVIAGGGNTAIEMAYTYGCWAKNNDLSIGTTAHIGYIFMWNCLRPEVRHNYLHDTGVADRYGIHTRMVAGLLCEDNIMNGHSTMLMVNGVSGSVYAYNYGVNLDGNTGLSFMVAGILTHGGTPNMVLFEGNWAPEIQLDTQWQNSAYMVGFRNRLTGKRDNGTAANNVQAVAVMELHHHATFIGNVLGTSGMHTTYQDDGTGSPCHDGHRVWFIGTRSGGDCGTSNYDPASLSTLIRAVNWDSANGAMVGGGFTISDLPNSYYLASKPAYFGNLPWPAFNPASPNLGSTSIPAGYRYVNGTDPSGGGATPTPTPAPSGTPQPPQGLHIVNPSPTP
jgi:hypothetical protein